MEGEPSPFSLKNYLAYGTLGIAIRPHAIERLRWQETVAEDGWKTFDEGLLPINLGQSLAGDYALISELSFLVQQKFISASYCLHDGDNMIVRVYLIPYDLPGVRGQLRVRELKVVRDARSYLTRLLPRICRSAECWNARKLPEPATLPPGKTLTEIYETLPSPEPRVRETSLPVIRRLLDFADGLDGLGLRSKLYKYQRRSVAAMLQKEMDLRDDPDPLFFPIVGLDDKEMFLQPGTLELLLERPCVAPCRGGILCEELGTGKTVITLALVLSTLHQLSEPEPSIIEARPVLTPLAFRHFPSAEFGTARARTKGGEFSPTAEPRVPRLVELLLHHMATKPMESVPKTAAEYYASLQDDLERLEQYTGPRADNIPFYLSSQPDPVDNDRAEKKRWGSGPSDETRLLYLTSATLVIVPQNLLLQWKNECLRHCEYPLRVLSLDGNAAMPSARELASKYDLILMPINRFSATKQGKPTWKPCKCPEYPGQVRVPKCVCKPPDCSPLRQIRWKRLVIDEGHVSASLTTKLTPFVKSLSVERRWIVTGTPTTNLLGLNLGKNLATFDDDLPASNEVSDFELSRAPSEEPEFYDVDTDSRVSDSLPRVWNKDDGQDLTQLGNMIAHFVGVPQLLANANIIKTHLKDALLDKCGPRIGAIEILQQLMASVMIRHRITEVEEEVVLPPVASELVLLDLDPLSIKSYNAMQATIAMNAVLSEREDQDYMFHAQNVEFLQETIRNMSQLMFWRVDDNFYNARDLIFEHAKEYQSKLSPSKNPEDFQLFNEALRHLEIAYSDPLWKAVQSHEDVPYHVRNLARPVFEAWTRTPFIVDEGEPSFAGYMHPDRLRTLREKVLAKPLSTEQYLVELGELNAKEDVLKRQEYEESLTRRKGGARYRPESSSTTKAKEATKRAAESSTISEMQKELELVAHGNAGFGIPTIRNVENRPSALVASSPIARTRFGPTASSKLNFIIEEVLRYSDEKFLIFSDSPLTLAHIGEALELIGVYFLRFSGQIPRRVREQFVLTFETSPKYRIFLMELKHGARGLNLISASRVIFCEPVWRADVESQAIKRCHRIGQKKERISVKTLAIRGTAEETMAARRVVFKDSGKAPKMIEEKGMRDFIANPKFLTHAPTSLSAFDVPLVDLTPLEEDVDVPIPDIFPADPQPSPPPRQMVQLNSPEPSQRPAEKRRLDFGESAAAGAEPPPAKRPKPRNRLVFDLQSESSDSDSDSSSSTMVPQQDSPPPSPRPRTRAVRFA